jgi:hypothetical protein
MRWNDDAYHTGNPRASLRRRGSNGGGFSAADNQNVDAGRDGNVFNKNEVASRSKYQNGNWSSARKPVQTPRANRQTESATPSLSTNDIAPSNRAGSEARQFDQGTYNELERERKGRADGQPGRATSRTGTVAVTSALVAFASEGAAPGQKAEFAGMIASRDGDTMNVKNASGVVTVVVTPSGMDSSKPVATNATPEGPSTNRRVEVLVNKEINEQFGGMHTTGAGIYLVQGFATSVRHERFCGLNVLRVVKEF